MSSGGVDKSVKRNLPSWMSSRDNGSKSYNNDEHDEASKREKSKEAKGHGRKSGPTTTKMSHFSKHLEGVVVVLSGFVNPERSTLRSQALEMGAEYQPDWNSDCTLLICAFPNTPKFRQVQADNGTIVSKEWISDCYKEKKLVDIESHLMNAGKPWRKTNVSLDIGQDQKKSPSRKSQQQVESGSHPKSTSSMSSKEDRNPDPSTESFSPSTLKKWAIDDLNRTVTWLESQDEKPEPSEIKKIAIEGILVCLQDAIDSLEQKQDVRKITEQWSFIPRAVEELAKLEGAETGSVSLTKEDLYTEAKVCRKIYETTLRNLADDPTTKKKLPKTDDTGYDSEDTIEMTEEEIDLAYKVSSTSKICK